MQLRAPTKDTHPNMWDISAAGHVSAGEQPLDAARRETFEELGIVLSEEQLEHIGVVRQHATLHGGTYFNKEINDIYLVRLPLKLEEYTLQKEEVAAVREIPLTEFEKTIDPTSIDVVQHPEEFEILLRHLS